MKNKTLKAEAAPAKYVGCNIDGHHSYRADVAPAQAGEPYQSADSASESARQLSKSASLHLAHPWQAHSAHEFAASRHEVESGTSKIPEDRERHFRLASEHRKAAEYWAKKEAESGDRRAPASNEQHTPIAEKQEELQRLAKVINQLASERDQLLEALKEMVSAMWQHFEYHHDGDDDCRYPQMAIDQARAAIAKAEGRE